MKEFLQKYLTVSDQEYAAAMGMAKERTYKKNELIFKEGKWFDRLLFVTRGLIRSYRIADGEDITYSFFAANDFASDYASFLQSEPTKLNFIAMADTTVLEWTKENVHKLYDASHQFERMGRLMAEKAYLQVTSRLKEFQTDSLEDRYKQLVSRNPQLVLHVPQRHIASMLGVKPQSLSRVKAKLAKRALVT